MLFFSKMIVVHIHLWQYHIFYQLVCSKSTCSHVIKLVGEVEPQIGPLAKMSLTTIGNKWGGFEVPFSFLLASGPSQTGLVGGVEPG